MPFIVIIAAQIILKGSFKFNYLSGFCKTNESKNSIFSFLILSSGLSLLYTLSFREELTLPCIV